MVSAIFCFFFVSRKISRHFADAVLRTQIELSRRKEKELHERESEVN